MNKKNILVIGGSGFLGSHVADALSDAGYLVKIFDRQSSKWLRSNQEMIIGDLLDYNLILEHTKNCYAVYNFAAIADLNEAILKPIDTAKVNILGNVQVLEACKVNQVKRYIYASTVYVHSREGGFYKCSKQASENYVEEYQKSYGLEYTILRYGSLYGPRSDEHNGLWRIVKDVLESGIVKYEGNIESVREYIHVEDAARASVTALGEDFKNEHVVLTGHEPLKVMDMLKMLSEIMGIEQEVQFENLPYAGHYIRTPYAYQTKLGRKFIPPMHVDLGQGLLQLIQDIKTNHLNHKINNNENIF
jgi:UDP-glucose 4-epimerase